LPPPVLVIGVGNDLRGDDAAGWVAAGRVAAWGRPGVTVIRTRQLLPELAADVACAAAVVLIDARVGGSDTPAITPVEGEPAAATLTHSASLAQLLALARDAYGRAPRGFALGIPAAAFDFGAAVSPACAAGVEAALRLLSTVLPDG
jgi:hydrogenase maturation protease